MTLEEFLMSPVPIVVVVLVLLDGAVHCIIEDYYRNRLSKECGYDCLSCRAWFCHGRVCYWRHKQNTRHD